MYLEINKQNENNYKNKQTELVQLKTEKEQYKQKYDEVNTWNQEIKSYLD